MSRPSGRRSVELSGLGHGTQPFPLASRRGPLLATSAIHGIDPQTGAAPEAVSAEVAQAFDNLAGVVGAAGGSMDDVVQVLVTLTDKGDRPVVNEHWVRWFPDETSRPARNTVERPLAAGLRVNLVAVAWIESPHL